MTIDTSVARRVFKQCLYLAGPGVLVMSGVVALFLRYWLDWSFMLSLCTGSILCATDPVAVVALLKELGASPTLTVQIQGESLLNDGTAIVLYTVAYDILRGEQYDAADVAMFIVKTAIMAVALGVFLGYFFFTWIRAASNRFNHSSPIIQILLTLCAAYWSFVLAEGVLKMSGVLATVACSLVLAQNMWPYIVEREAMLDFWHAFENLGNIIIFFLGGALTGGAMVNIEIMDYLNLIVIYLVLLVLRGGFIFGSRPLLQLLHKDNEKLTVADAMVMTWGGLRGAVGLALGMQVARGRALGTDGVHRLEQSEANRVLFFVGGIAFLTTCVNASTCPMLVDWLGITSLPEADASLLQKFNNQLISFSQSQDNPAEVTQQLQAMLEGISRAIGKTGNGRIERSQRTSIVDPAKSKLQPAADIIQKYNELFEDFSDYDEDDKKTWECIPDDMGGQVKTMLTLIQDKPADKEICKSINNTFLTVVNNNYWRQITRGNLKPGSEESDLLFTSVRFSLLKSDLDDYRFLSRFAGVNDAGAIEMALARSGEISDSIVIESALGKFVTSGFFNIAVAIAIVTNVFFVVLEEVSRDPNDDSPIWLIMEAIFAVIFTAEFIVKFSYLWCDFFNAMWNSFDFSLVILGILGLVMSILSVGQKSGSSGSESRIIRISRVLRTMRFLRLFRLFHANLGKDPLISEELANTMKHMSILNNFVVAHAAAQKSMLKFFAGSAGASKEVELARCLLQSQISVLEATAELNTVLKGMEPALVLELQNTRFRKGVIEQLENRIEEALQYGAITSKNAASLLHPLHHELSDCISRVTKLREGRKDLGGGHGHGHGADKGQDAAEKEGREKKDQIESLMGASITHCLSTQYKKAEFAPSEKSGVGFADTLPGADSGDAAAGMNAASSLVPDASMVLMQEDFSTGGVPSGLCLPPPPPPPLPAAAPAAAAAGGTGVASGQGLPPPVAAAVTYGKTTGPEPSRTPGEEKEQNWFTDEPDGEPLLLRASEGLASCPLALEGDTGRKPVKRKKRMAKRVIAPSGTDSTSFGGNDAQFDDAGRSDLALVFDESPFESSPTGQLDVEC